MSIKGIDVSNWQGGCNIRQAIAVGGLSFVIAKASGGVYYKDPYCMGFIDTARDCGCMVGTYHYANDFGTFEEPEREAEFYFNTVCDTLEYANTALDIECDLPCSWGEYADRFCNRFEELSGQQPMIYCSASQCGRFAGYDVVKKSALWVAGYPKDYTYFIDRYMPYDINPWSSASIWQFSSSVQLAGIEFDANLAYIATSGDWLNLCRFGAENGTDIADDTVPDSVVIDVFRGKYGNGQDRRVNLAKAGYDYDAVQNRVNDIFYLAHDTMCGAYGNGEERKRRLGAVYNVVQNVVNVLMGE